MERMEEDDLENVRRKRLETMKRNHKQKQEWVGKPLFVTAVPLNCRREGPCPLVF